MSWALAAAPRPGARARRGESLLAAAILSLVLALFFAPALIGSGQFLSRDAGRLHAPVKRYLAGRLGRGELPQWNPYDGLGAPVVAGAVDAPQHPFNLLLVGLPFELGFKSWVLLSYLLAATGGFAWASALRHSFHASLAAGLAFSLSGVLVSTSDNLTYLTAFATLPWIFASAHRWMERGGTGRLALLGVASACAAAAGDPQSWGVAILSLPFYATWVAERGPRSPPAAFRRGLLGLGVALVAAAPFVLPVVLWLPHSSRAAPVQALDQHRYAMAPFRLLELALPHLTTDEPGVTYSEVYRAYAGDDFGVPWYLSLYAGAAVVALASLGAARDRRARRLLLAAGVFAWMALGHHAGFAQLARHLPLLSGFRFWEKMAIWLMLCLAGATARGFDLLLEGGPPARRFAAAAGAAAAAALSLRAASALAPAALARTLQLGTSPQAAATARRFAANLGEGLLSVGLVLAALTMAAVLCRRPGAARWAPAALLAVVFLDLSAGNLHAYILSPRSLADLSGPISDHLAARPDLQRVATPFQLAEHLDPRLPALRPAEVAWMWGGLMLYPAFNVARRIGNVGPSGPMAPGRVTRFTDRKGAGKMLPAVGMWGAAWAVIPANPSAAATVNLPPPHDVAVADSWLPAYLVRMPHRPRAYLAERLSSVDRRGAMEFVLDDRSTATDRSVVEGPIPGDYLPPRGEARIAQDEPERVELEVSCDRRALLVLNDAYAAGWSATVDGNRVEILATNYLARGIWLDGGVHRAVFHYRTPGLAEGWALVAAGALALGGHVLWRRRREPA